MLLKIILTLSAVLSACSGALWIDSYSPGHRPDYWRRYYTGRGQLIVVLDPIPVGYQYFVEGIEGSRLGLGFGIITLKFQLSLIETTWTPEPHATRPDTPWKLRLILVPLPLVTAGSAGIALGCGGLLIARNRGRRRRLKNGLCLHCGFDLRESSGVCPECGRVADTGAAGAV